MSYENILVERADGVAAVTVNRPKVLNALNRADADRARRMPSTRCATTRACAR